MPLSNTMAVFMLALALESPGCGVGVTSRCWGDSMGVNFCTHFVQQHPWTGTVAITDALFSGKDGSRTLVISDQLSTTTGIASTLGGSIAGEVAQHVVVAP